MITKNIDGAFGTGDIGSQPKPVKAQITSATDICAGNEHSCVVSGGYVVVVVK